VEYLDTYKIPFAGLELGRHEFEFKVNDKFFSFFEYSIVQRANLEVMVKLVKQETMLLLTFQIEGTVMLQCDTCLSEIEYPLSLEEQLAVKFERENWSEEEENDEVMVLSNQEHELNIVKLLYDYINVAIPYYPKCEMVDKACDPEMMKIIRQDLSPNKSEENIDPRWEKLKRIKNN